MICQNCKKNPVALHLEKIINGVKTEYHLCEECACKMNYFMSFDDMFKNFINSFINTENENSVNNKKDIQPDFKCPTCGYSFNDFRQTSKLGCADCYSTFRKQLNAILKNIQGSNVHNGKFPEKYGSELLAVHKLENLKASLKKVIENEEYEEAAKIRDEIKEIEKRDS